MTTDLYPLLGPNAERKSKAVGVFVTEQHQIGSEHTQKIETLIDTPRTDIFVGTKLARIAANDPEIRKQGHNMPSDSVVNVVSNLMQARQALLGEHNYDDELRSSRGEGAESLSKRLGVIIGCFFAEVARISPSSLIDSIRQFATSRATPTSEFSS